MIEAVGFSHQGLVRTNNEDHYFASVGTGLCVLADGMGGAQAGETASALAVSAVAEVATAAPPSLSLLEAAFLEADRRVRQASASDTSLRGMGTTLVAALETPAGIRGFQYRRQPLLAVGKRSAHSVDQRSKLDQRDWAPPRSSEEALTAHPLRHALTTAVGVGTETRVQSRTVQAQAGSLILLSSDGLHGVVTGEAISAVLLQGGPLLSLCHKLIDLALAGGGPDNVTVVLARL